MTNKSALILYSLFVLTTLSVLPSFLFAQRPATTERWLGLNNMFYKNRYVESVDTLTFNDLSVGVRTTEDFDRQISLGLHYRLLKDNGLYQQFELISLDLNTQEDVEVVQIPGESFSTPIRGADLISTNIRIGYRHGKLFKITDKFTADASVGGYPTFQYERFLPYTSASFTERNTRIGLGLDIRLGLNYQIHPSFNLSYSFAPVAGQWFWHQQYIGNPILTEEQKRNQDLEMQTSAFEQVLDFRNISLRYVLPADGKKDRKRARKR